MNVQKLNEHRSKYPLNLLQYDKTPSLYMRIDGLAMFLFNNLFFLNIPLPSTLKPFTPGRLSKSSMSFC